MDIITKRPIRVYGVDYSANVKYTVANPLGNFMIQSGFASAISNINLGKWSDAKTAAQVRKRPAILLMLGDSTTAAYGAGATPGNAYNDLALRSSYGAQAAILINSKIMKAGFDGIFGTANSVSSGLAYPLYDPRVTLGAGWAAISNSTTFGGGFFEATTTTAGTLDFILDSAFDTFKVFWIGTTTSTPNLVVQVDGSSAGYAPINAYGYGIYSQQYTIPGILARHKISFSSPNAGVVAWVQGVTCWNSNNPGVIVCNSGIPGATASVISATSSPYNGILSVTLLAPDLTIINLTINDQSVQTASATYIAAMTIIIDTALLSGDAIVLVNSPNKNIGFTNGYMNTITPLLKSVCDARNVPMIDLRDSLGATWDIANAAGYMDPGSTVHPNAVGLSKALESFFKYL